MHRFKLLRNEDETGMSGTGYVAEGVEFSNGLCAMNWTTSHSSIGIYPSIEELVAIHGHGGRTVVEWQDYKPLIASPEDDYCSRCNNCTCCCFC